MWRGRACGRSRLGGQVRRRRAIRIAIGFRQISQVLFPGQILLERLRGLFTIRFIESTCGGMDGVTAYLPATLLHGAIVHVLWGVFGEVVYLISRATMKHAGLCRNCSDDLCATSDRCPECGTPVANAAPPSATA